MDNIMIANKGAQGTTDRHFLCDMYGVRHMQQASYILWQQDLGT